MKIETVTILVADEGKVFQRVEDGEVLGEMLSLGVGDRAENYVEVEEVETL